MCCANCKKYVFLKEVGFMGRCKKQGKNNWVTGHYICDFCDFFQNNEDI